MKRALIGLTGALALVQLGVGSASGASLTRSSSFGYDANTGLLTQEVIEPNTPALRLEKDYTYDTFGNKISASTSGADIAARTSASTYDAAGQFVVKNTNALGQSETFAYDSRFGQPTSHTGPNGLTTTWQYDSFGRKVRELRPDGNQTTWTYSVCLPNCPHDASREAYTVAAAPLAADGATQIGPVTVVAYDRLDREIFRFVQAGTGQGFGGDWITVQTVYDTSGRVQKKSRPYFWGATPVWTTFTYDILGRVVSKTDADNSVTQQAYHGLVTAVTNALNQTTTTRKNSEGQVVSVTDAANNATTYTYDAFGNLLTTTDALGNVVANTYDARGRKIGSHDPDLGVWTYTYNTLDQVTTQIDAKGQVTTWTYDLLGRKTQRVEPDMTAVWVYDTALHGVGQLTSASITAGADSGFQRSYAYDGLGRPVQATTIEGGTSYTFTAAYDSSSRLYQVTYPSGFVLGYTYTSFGYLSQLTAPATGQVFWTANLRDAELHVLQQTAGNGLVTSQTFSTLTGHLLQIQAGLSNAVANFSYNYDVLGNLTSRSDANENLSENLVYDNLNRLTQSTVSLTPTPLVKTFAYNPIGNLLIKSDVGNYLYPAAGGPLPHAVTSISGGVISSTFTYDLDGNQTAGLGRFITYTSYNKPASITQGSSAIFFAHDTNHQRFKQTSSQGTTLYFDVFGIHAELIQGATTQWSQYLIAGGTMVGVRFERSDETVSTRYFTQDHLGSIAVITDENATVVERLSYDAWGKRRFPNGTDDPADSISSQTSRGFTGQEMLGSVGLVHLNGRIYDPIIGRMTTPDPFVPDPTNGQAWNRYSYVINNPLSITDPNGYCFLGLCSVFNAIGHFFTSVFHGLQNLLRSVPILGNIIQIAAAGICALTPGCQVALVAILSSAAVAGITSGNLGAALKAGAIAGLTALAFNAVGNVTGHLPTFGTPQYFENIAGHALVGCASSVASGGKCGPGALAAGVTSAAGPVINHQGFVAGLVANSVLGGVASVAGGGKFANGAMTGAFGYLFNGAAEYLKGVLGEQLFDNMIAARGGVKVGSQLNYYIVDYEGKPVYRADGSLSAGVMDRLTEEGSGLFADEVKNGPRSALNSNQHAQIPALADGRAVFYGQNAEYAGIAGQSAAEVANTRGLSWGGYRLWGFGGSPAPGRLLRAFPALGGRIRGADIE